jgi:GPI mannosyltransferase 3
MQTNETTLSRTKMVGFAVIVLVTAWFSIGRFHADEHAQTVEFAAGKLFDETPGAWEWRGRVRPFFQPALYFVVLRLLSLVGVKDHFTFLFALRLVTGVFATYALFEVIKSTLRHLSASFHEAWSKTFQSALLCFGFLPYLLVRTSSETLSAAFFGLAYVVLISASARVNTLGKPWQWFLGGLLLGAAFEARFQTGLMSAGLAAWLLIIRRSSLRQLLMLTLGFASMLAVGALCDRWGYGEWVLPPIRYVKENLLNGTAASFGTAPFYAYLYFLPANIFVIPLAALVISVVVATVRRWRHPVIWSCVPFILVHCLLAHKEERFFFPLMLLSLPLPILAFAPRARHPDAMTPPPSYLRKAIRLATPFSLVPMIFLMVYPFGFRDHPRFDRFVYRNYQAGFRAYRLEEEAPSVATFYRPPLFDVADAYDAATLAHVLEKMPNGIDVLTAKATLSPKQLPADSTWTRTYNECPLADDSSDGSKDRCAPIETWLLGSFLPPLRLVRVFHVNGPAKTPRR